jgi:hypothetical protein
MRLTFEEMNLYDREWKVGGASMLISKYLLEQFDCDGSHLLVFTWHGLGQSWGYGSGFVKSAYCIGQSSSGDPLVDPCTKEAH